MCSGKWDNPATLPEQQIELGGHKFFEVTVDFPKSCLVDASGKSFRITLNTTMRRLPGPSRNPWT